MTYEVDIISIPVTERLPFVLKRAPVNGVRGFDLDFTIILFNFF